jgi:hypothetical protein
MGTFRLIAALLLIGSWWSTGCSDVPDAEDKGVGNMATFQDKVVELITLQDEEFFDLDEAGVSELRKKLSEMNTDAMPNLPPDVPWPTELPPVLAIAAPRLIRIDKQKERPVLIATRTTGLRDWQVDWRQNGRAILVDLNNGAMKSARLYGTHKRRSTPLPSMSGPEPDDINAATVSTDVNKHTTMLDFLGIEWRPGRFALVVVNYDWVSNAVEVVLEQEEAEPLPIPEARPASAFLRDGIGSDSAPKPDPFGLAVSMPNEVELRAPILFECVVEIPSKHTATGPLATAAEPDGAAGSTVALLASVILVARDAESPIPINLVIKATLVDSIGSDQVVQAHFSFDVQEALPDRLLQGMYQVYLVAGSRLSGPHPLRVGSSLVR